MTWCLISRLLTEPKNRTSRVLLNQVVSQGLKQIIHKNNKGKYFDVAASDPHRVRLYCWGYAAAGALGEQKIKNLIKQDCVHHPIRKYFGLTHKLVDVACGYGYTLYVTHKEGGRQLYGSGLNTDSQIGFQSVRGPKYPLKIIYNIVPIRIPLESSQTKVQKVAAGRAHSLVLTDREGVFSCGNNSFGQCGRRIIENEDYSAYRELWRLKSLNDERIIDMVCGHDHTLFLTDAGKVFSCGNGADGQTGLGHYKVCWNPTLVEGDIKDEKIVKLSSTSDTVLAINDKGDVFGWGNNEYFQLPLNETNQQVNTPAHLSRIAKLLGPVKDVASSGSICMALTLNGEVFVWGHGLLGKGPEFMHLEEPSLIPLQLFGYSQFKPDVKVASLSCGVSTLAAVNNYGDLYIWGKNNYGQLGLAHQNDQFYPTKVAVGGTVVKVSCGIDHTMALCKPFS